MIIRVYELLVNNNLSLCQPLRFPSIQCMGMISIQTLGDGLGKQIRPPITGRDHVKTQWKFCESFTLFSLQISHGISQIM